MQDIHKQAENALLTAANEDFCGLYQAIWELNTLFPTMSIGDKYKLAEAALESLLSKGLIQLERMDTAPQLPAYTPLDPAKAAEIFGDPTSWYPEYPEHIQIGFSATQKGKEAWELG